MRIILVILMLVLVTTNGASSREAKAKGFAQKDGTKVAEYSRKDAK